MRRWIVAIGVAGACSQGSQHRPGAGPEGEGESESEAEAESEGEPVAGLQLRVVEPDHGPFSGGNEVLLRGTGFEGVAQVLFGDHQAEPAFVRVLDPTRVLAIVPPGVAGAVDVTVCVERDGEAGCDLASDGAADVLDEASRLPMGYRYDAFRIQPADGPASGGTYVTIDGHGTEFDADTVVTIGGVAVQGLAVISATQMTALTPPGGVGPADVRITTAAGDLTVRAGFTYFESIDPIWGGLGGEQLAASFKVHVMDAVADAPIANAFVMLGTDPLGPHQGVTDADGEVVFEGEFAPPIEVTASADGYSRATIDTFDANEAELWLFPIPDPAEGPPPPPGPGLLPAHLEGVIVFGGPDGAGTRTWDIVPPPPSRDYFLCATVDRTRPGLYVNAPRPVTPEAHVCFDGEDRSPEGIAWTYSVDVIPGTMAMYAMAGWCRNLVGDFCGPNPAASSYEFEPWAIGVVRGVSVGPGEAATVDIIVDTPLDRELDVTWVDPPPGMFSYTLDVALDLGGDGILYRGDARAAMGPGLTNRVGHMAPLTGPGLFDASYIVLASATGGFGPPTPLDGWEDFFYGLGFPFSVRVLRGITDPSQPVILDGFVLPPTFVAPPFFSEPQQGRFAFSSPGATPSFHNVWLIAADSLVPYIMWWYVLEGGQTQFQLPDVVRIGGVPEVPTHMVAWFHWSIHMPEYQFDAFNYGQFFDPAPWDAFAADASYVLFP